MVNGQSLGGVSRTAAPGEVDAVELKHCRGDHVFSSRNTSVNQIALQEHVLLHGQAGLLCADWTGEK